MQSIEFLLRAELIILNKKKYYIKYIYTKVLPSVTNNKYSKL